MISLFKQGIANLGSEETRLTQLAHASTLSWMPCEVMDKAANEAR
jgi:hypothetical protein